MKSRLLALLLVLTSFTSALNKSDQRWIDAVSETYGERAAKRVTTWRSNIATYGGLSEREKLESINQFFNQMYFVDDSILWGKNDYWSNATGVLRQ